MELNKLYPKIYKLGCTVDRKPVDHIKWKALNTALKKAKIMKKFSELFGVQTCLIDGPYAWDVEAVLVRIYDKKLTGTQLIPD